MGQEVEAAAVCCFLTKGCLRNETGGLCSTDIFDHIVLVSGTRINTDCFILLYDVVCESRCARQFDMRQITNT
jgi:hypothetical protein